MGGPSANRVTSIAADAIGGNAGIESTSIATENLPEHEHDLEGASGTQFYGIRVGAGEPVDDNAISLPIEPGLRRHTRHCFEWRHVKTAATLRCAYRCYESFLSSQLHYLYRRIT